MARIHTEEAVRRSLADAHGDEDEAIARSITDEAARRHTAAKRLTNAATDEPHHPRHAQHNSKHASAQPTATHTNTIQLVSRKTDEPSSASLMTAGDEQWPADDDGVATMQNSAPTSPPTHSRPATQDVQTRPANNPDETPPANQQHMPAHFHPSKRHRGRRVIRESPVTTASASQPSDAHPDGKWLEARMILDLTIIFFAEAASRSLGSCE